MRRNVLALTTEFESRPLCLAELFMITDRNVLKYILSKPVFKAPLHRYQDKIIFM